MTRTSLHVEHSTNLLNLVNGVAGDWCASNQEVQPRGRWQQGLLHCRVLARA